MNTLHDLHWACVHVHTEDGQRVLLYSALLHRKDQHALRLWREERWQNDKPKWDENNRCLHVAYWHGRREDRHPAYSSIANCLATVQQEPATLP